ncbi:MAG: hypothetical protein IIC71_10685 [Acidobacteria bacterium]|nr:hypothetical protein [Acidobacteriota bacterium]
MNKRRIATVSLFGFVGYAGIYIFIYLWRAFRVAEPENLQYVALWHGDNFSRSILVSVLFLIGLVVMLHVSLLRRQGGSGQITLRLDVQEWLVRQAEATNEDPSRLADRAISTYRARVEGTRTTS